MLVSLPEPLQKVYTVFVYRVLNQNASMLVFHGLLNKFLFALGRLSPPGCPERGSLPSNRVWSNNKGTQPDSAKKTRMAHAKKTVYIYNVFIPAS